MFQPQVIYGCSSHSFWWNYSFWNWEIVANSNSCPNISVFLLSKPNSFFKNYSREETNQGGKYKRKYGSHRKMRNSSTQEISEMNISTQKCKTTGCRVCVWIMFVICGVEYASSWLLYSRVGALGLVG